jgi:hypothetical protein
MVGAFVVQCAVTSTIARGCSGVPSFKILGTLVLSDFVMAACEGSPRMGMGPPPCEMEMTGATRDMFVVCEEKKLRGSCCRPLSGLKVKFPKLKSARVRWKQKAVVSRREDRVSVFMVW